MISSSVNTATMVPDATSGPFITASLIASYLSGYRSTMSSHVIRLSVSFTIVSITVSSYGQYIAETRLRKHILPE